MFCKGCWKTFPKGATGSTKDLCPDCERGRLAFWREYNSPNAIAAREIEEAEYNAQKEAEAIAKAEAEAKARAEAAKPRPPIEYYSRHDAAREMADWKDRHDDKMSRRD